MSKVLLEEDSMSRGVLLIALHPPPMMKKTSLNEHGIEGLRAPLTSKYQLTLDRLIKVDFQGALKNIPAGWPPLWVDVEKGKGDFFYVCTCISEWYLEICV